MRLIGHKVRGNRACVCGSSKDPTVLKRDLQALRMQSFDTIMGLVEADLGPLCVCEHGNHLDSIFVWDRHRVFERKSKSFACQNKSKRTQDC